MNKKKKTNSLYCSEDGIELEYNLFMANKRVCI